MSLLNSLKFLLIYLLYPLSLNFLGLAFLLLLLLLLLLFMEAF